VHSLTSQSLQVLDGLDRDVEVVALYQQLDQPPVRELLRYLSTDAHLEELVKGLIDSADLVYFAVMIGSFLVLTKAAVESVRWR
jgi:hypothetical protein